MILYALYAKPRKENTKRILFVLIVVPVVLTSLYMAGSTFYLNMTSYSGGPIHWHADFEVWNCGERVDIEDPKNLENRVGSAVFHEHGDDRIHMEGILVEKEDASLGEFIEIIGGEVGSGYVSLPTDNGVLEMRDGNLCNGESGEIQAFVYRVTNPDPTKKSGFIYKQEKLDDYSEYVLSPYFNVPPGDCIVIEFDQPKDKTDKMCETYMVAMDKGDLTGS